MFPDGIDGAGVVGSRPEPSPEDALVNREQIGYLHDAVSALPERLRVVVEAY